MAVTAVRRRQSQPVVRWNPFEDLEHFQQQLTQLLTAIPDPGTASDLWAPPVDIEETEDAWLLEAEVPGVDRDDIDVELRDDELVIHGEVKERERKGVLRRRTRRVGEFEYRVTLPGHVDPEGLEARLSDGVLRIRVRKAEHARSRHIDILPGDGRAQGDAPQEGAGSSEGS
jgi:HSP20 family protein